MLKVFRIKVKVDMDIKALKIKYGPKIIGTGINTIGLVSSKKAVSIALDIFRSPRKGAIESREKKFLKKFIYKELLIDGIKVATYDNNKAGKKVLLCHGWESNSSRWRKLYKELSKTDLNIIMVDAPAHGSSGSDKFDGKIYASFINCVVDHYQPNAIVGHSVGAYSVIYAMYKYQPKCVTQLVIMSSPDKLSDITNRYFNIIGLSKRLRGKYFQAMDDLFEFSSIDFNAADFAKNIDVPTLIIHDREDYINLFFESEAIHESLINSELVATSGFGHSLQHLVVYQKILNCLSSI